MELEMVMTILKFAGVFVGLSFIVFWIGLVWWVSQDVVSRTNDKIILALSVALASIFGPIGVLLYLIVRPRQTIRETYREMLETEINRKLASLDMTYCPFCGANLEHDVDKHEVHPRQLSMTDLEQLTPAKSPMTDEVWVEEFVEKESRLRRLIVPGAQKISGRSKRLGAGVIKATAGAGKAVLGGVKFLLTPLPEGQRRVDNQDTGEPSRGAPQNSSPALSNYKASAPRAGSTDDEDKAPEKEAAKPVKPAAKKKVATKKKAVAAKRRAKK